MRTNDFSVDKQGYYGAFGGQYAPEVLMPALEELDECFSDARNDSAFLSELRYFERTYTGRPTRNTASKRDRPV